MEVENTKMCIYQIMHKESGEKYIGQTTRAVKIRWKLHCRYDSGCLKLKNAIQKYGKEAFDYKILEKCETIDQLNEREVHWIKELNTLDPNGYNLTTGGMNSIPSEATKLKIKNTRESKPYVVTEATKVKIRAARALQFITPESYKKMIETKNNQPEEIKKKIADAVSRRHTGKLVSSETRKKLSESNKGRVVPKERHEKMMVSLRLYQLKKDELNPPSEKQLKRRLGHAKRVARRKFNLENTTCSLV